MTKRILSLLLAGTLIFSLVPAQVLATEENVDNTEVPPAASEEATDPTETTTLLITDPANSSDDDDSDGDDDVDPASEGEQETKTWTVTFDRDDGSPVTIVDVEDGKGVTPPADPEDPNLVFGGWYDERGIKWSFENNIVKSNVTLYAKWQIKVTFMDGSKELGILGVDNNAKIDISKVPKQEKLELVGWYRDADFKTPWNFDKDIVDQTTTLYGKWQVKVTFDHKYGNTTTFQFVERNSTISEPQPERGSYRFDGWFTETTLKNKWTFNTTPFTQNIVLYAKWDATVNFYSNSEKVDTIYVATGHKVPLITPPSRGNDYTFVEWCDKDGKTWESDAIVSNHTINLYAKWETTVTFIDSMDNTTITTQTVVENGKATKPTLDLQKEGYVFGGWYKEADLKNQWNFDMDTVKGPTTLYAMWLDAVTVTFESNSGSSVKSQLEAKNGTITKPTDPTREGYLFDGWYADATLKHKWDFDSYKVTKDTKLYAKWLEAVTVTFNSNGGSAVAAQTIEKNTKVTKPADPTREGFLFAGWYTDAELKTKWNFVNYWVPENITLHAKWLDAVTVTFDSNGGSTVAAQKVVKNSTVEEPAAPTKTDRVFDGWYMDAELKTKWNFAFYRATEDITLYAKWKVEVSFDSKGGSAVASQILEEGSKAIKPADPVKSNAKFEGWYNGTSKWDFTKDTVSKNTKLTAKWTENPLAISRKGTADLYPGDSDTFTVKLDNKDISSSSVSWSVSGHSDKNTKISSSGVLTIGGSEKAGTIKIIAATGDYRSEFYVTINPAYQFVSGGGSKWAQKSSKNLTFECNGPMKEISKDGIKIGSTAVKEENYTLSESVHGFKLVLKPAAMSSLAVGKHTLTITFDDGGKAETTFEVVKESDIPETGDALMLPLWMALMSVTAAAALVLLKKRSL